MKRFYKINKRNSPAFTLLELILMIAIVAIAGAGIYKYYIKKQERQFANTQSQYLEQLRDSIGNIFASSNNLTSLTPANVIASQAAPLPLVANPTTINNLFGGTIQFTNLGGVPPSFGIVLNNIPTDACTFMSTSNFGNLSQQILINGTPVKTTGTSITAATVANIANACSANLNTIEFQNQIFRMSDIPVVSTTPVRSKENPYYIASIASPVTSPAVSCTGGTSWNGNMCSCPSGNQWNGTSCIPYGSQPGACPLGTAWNGASCASIGGPGEIYLSGRPVPNLGYGTIQQTATGNVCSSGGHFDGKTCQTCTNGTWNGYRCVTP